MCSDTEASNGVACWEATHHLEHSVGDGEGGAGPEKTQAPSCECASAASGTLGLCKAVVSNEVLVQKSDILKVGGEAALVNQGPAGLRVPCCHSPCPLRYFRKVPKSIGECGVEE